VAELIRAEAEPRSDAPPLPEVAVTASARRSRVSEALVCPFCRDRVTRRGTVACARPGCGALYHRSCWEEVVSGYGGCAIYGCECRSSREVSAAGWAIRLAKLLFASVALPPRVLRALRRHERESVGTVFWQTVATTRTIAPTSLDDLGAHPFPRVYIGFFVGVLIPLSFFILTRILASWSGVSYRDFLGHGGWGVGAAASVFALALALVLPFLAAFPVVFGIYVERALAVLLRSELSALERADERTVLDGLRQGAGKARGSVV
jgi:hypothetical protein